MPAYARPDTLTDALQVIADGGRRVLAGGTDLYPGAGAALAASVLDLSRLSELCGISTDNGLRIGAMTTWTEIAEARLPPALAGLQQAARQVGARQVQNLGTIGGNLCNASPAADGVPPLLTLDAEVELASLRGVRRLPLTEFLQGPRKTALAPDELLLAVHLPPQALQGQGAFHKLGARAYLVISIAMAAVRLVTEGGRVADIALAIGACSPVARRLTAVETALRGQPLGHLAGLIRAEDVTAPLSPIDDVRATADYRLGAAVELVRRAVGALA